MNTPQKATVTAETPGTLVMTGVNGDSSGIKGALTFETRVRVLAQGGHTISRCADRFSGGRGFGDAADRGGYQLQELQRRERRSASSDAANLAAAEKKPFDALRQAHINEHQRLFRRVAARSGHHRRREEADRRAHPGFRRPANDPQLAALYFQFGRYLLISSSRPGGQPANLQGIWNDEHEPALGQQVHHQHQHRDELLAGRADQPRRVRRAAVRDGEGSHRDRRAHGQGEVRRARLGGAPQHRLWRATAPIDGAHRACGRRAARGCALHLWEHYEYSGDKAFLTKASIRP